MHSILQLIVITYILNHTLTIPDTQLHAITTQMRPHPAQSTHQPHTAHYASETSPRIANNQLKFLAAVIRNTLLASTLQRLQTLLRTQGDKKQTWLESFLLILGVTMVLEESQIMLQMRADARVVRGQKSKTVADHGAVRECEKVDDTFDFLKTLFHLKYKKRVQGAASWDEYAGHLVARAPSGAEAGFVRGMEDLLGSNRECLRYETLWLPCPSTHKKGPFLKSCESLANHLCLQFNTFDAERH